MPRFSNVLKYLHYLLKMLSFCTNTRTRTQMCGLSHSQLWDAFRVTIGFYPNSGAEGPSLFWCLDETALSFLLLYVFTITWTVLRCFMILLNLLKKVKVKQNQLEPELISNTSHHLKAQPQTFSCFWLHQQIQGSLRGQTGSDRVRLGQEESFQPNSNWNVSIQWHHGKRTAGEEWRVSPVRKMTSAQLWVLLTGVVTATTVNLVVNSRSPHI